MGCGDVEVGVVVVLCFNGVDGLDHARARRKQEGTWKRMSFRPVFL